jgi:ppGpp synthetase/RelA/SpoT-type nucleotidyltranferase
MLPVPETLDQQIFQTLYAAEQISQRLNSLVTTLSPKYDRAIFYTRGRVKSYESIRSKIARKRNFESRTDYTFSSITDLVGLRIVTLYDDDLLTAVDLIYDILRAAKAFTQPLISGEFVWTSIKEAKFFVREGSTDKNPDIYRRCIERYTQLITQDLISPLLVEHLKRRIDIVTAAEENYTYSSAHFIFDARYYSDRYTYVVPVEIQIRTALEDVWAEINHELLYKAKEYYVWSIPIVESYAQLKTDSDRLKKLVDSYPDEISSFKKHSDDRIRHIRFFREPKAPFHFHSSLGATLLYALGDHFLDGMGLNFTDYNQNLSSLSTTPSFDTLKECISKFREIYKKLEEQVDPEHEPLHASLLDQQLKIARFELLRLRAVGLIHFRHKIVGDGFEHIPRPAPQTPDPEFDAEAMVIYGMLCDIRNDATLLLKSVSAILFWKYYVLRDTNRDIAYSYLTLANEELEFDTSLPLWSVYYVVIPRTLAIELYKDLCELESAIPARGGGPALLTEIRTRVLTIVRYAMRSHSRVLIPNDRRGDILFGFDADESIVDAELIVLALLKYFVICGERTQKRDGIFDELDITQVFLEGLPAKIRQVLPMVNKPYPEGRAVEFDRLVNLLLEIYGRNLMLPK